MGTVTLSCAGLKGHVPSQMCCSSWFSAPRILDSLRCAAVDLYSQLSNLLMILWLAQGRAAHLTIADRLLSSLDVKLRFLELVKGGCLTCFIHPGSLCSLVLCFTVVVQLLVFALCALITGCFTYEIAVIKPNWLDILKGLIPKPSVGARRHHVHCSLLLQDRYQTTGSCTPSHAENCAHLSRMQLLKSTRQIR